MTERPATTTPADDSSRDDPSRDDLRLEDFRPHGCLRVAAHEVRRPRFPVIDAHNHLGPVFGGDWAERDAAELHATLDESGVQTLVDLDGGHGDALSRQVDRWVAPDPRRVLVFAGLDYTGWERDRAFGETEAHRLRDSAARGARGLKVWKLLGLRARDSGGRLVEVDDPRLDPLWATAAELHLPVVIHVADPIAFFEPLDATNERWEELRAHPDWHFWPTRPAGEPGAPEALGAAGGPGEPDARGEPGFTGEPEGPGFRGFRGFPPFDELLAAFDRLVGRHPATTFVGAHVGCAAEDLGLVSGMLDAHPNLHVDLAARLGELGRQPYTARAFFLRYPDRILFGTDLAADPAVYRLNYRFLETFDESFDYGLEPTPGQGRWQIHGIGLPDDVLRAVYRDNASRVLGLGASGLGSPGLGASG